jgi:hypothetical protein
LGEINKRENLCNYGVKYNLIKTRVS